MSQPPIGVVHPDVHVHPRLPLVPGRRPPRPIAQPPAAAALAVALLALGLALPATSQHVCVYCGGGDEPPDPDAVRLACTVNAGSSLTCEGKTLYDCGDDSRYTPVGNSISCGDQESDAQMHCSPKLVIADDRRLGLRAIITDLSCPDPGTIWTECSMSTPL